MPDTDPVAAAVAARLDDCRPLAEAQGDVADLLAAVEAVLAPPRSLFPATRGEDRGKHYCLDCTGQF